MLDRDHDLDHAIDEAVAEAEEAWRRIEQADIVIRTLSAHGYEIVKKEPTDGE